MHPDAAGKDGGYAAEARDMEIAQTFFEQEKDEINKKVGGYVQGAVKAKGCEVDAYGAASAGLKAAIEERMQERLEESNDAFLIIDRNEDALGKRTAPSSRRWRGTSPRLELHRARGDARGEEGARVDGQGGDAARDQIKKLQDEENALRRRAPRSRPKPRSPRRIG